MSKKIKKKTTKRNTPRPHNTTQKSSPTDYTKKLQQAVALHQQGDFTKAEQLYRAILKKSPHDPDANHLLGLLSHQAGANESAIELISQAIAIDPNAATYHSNLGIVYKSMGNLDNAVSSFQNAIRLAPNYADAYFNMGNLCRENGEPHQAIDHYRQTIKLQPNHPPALNNLGQVLEKNDHLDEAKAAYQIALRIKPDYPEALNNLGNVLSKQEHPDQAISCYRKALTIQPNYTEALCNLGIAYEQFGTITKACDCFRQTVSIKEDYTEAYRMLAGVKKFTDYHDKDLQQMEMIAARQNLSTQQRMHLDFALGKAYEDLGEYKKAFISLKEGNHIKRTTLNFSIDLETKQMETIKEIFTKELQESLHGVGNQDKTPIFITGMPRSGTSLVEQILASHPKVYGAGERHYLSNTLEERQTDNTSSFPSWVTNIAPTIFADLGTEYLVKIRKLEQEAPHIADKMPHNFLHIGMIKLILPKAKIIHCQRDPMDTCWSIFKNYFTGSHPYAYNLNELGQYYLLYQNIMQHWQETLPNNYILNVHYEKLVTSQEEETKRLLAHCELPWHKDCLNFHKTARSVRTASSSQVREPIHDKSIKKWQCYKSELANLAAQITLPKGS